MTLEMMFMMMMMKKAVFLTCFSVSVEHVDVHEVLEIVHQCASPQTSQFVSTLDALGLPVCPVDLIFVQRETKWMGQLATDQHLQTEKRCNAYILFGESTNQHPQQANTNYESMISTRFCFTESTNITESSSSTNLLHSHQIILTRIVTSCHYSWNRLM